MRDFAGLRRDDEPLDPFALARFAKLMVVDFDMIMGLSEETREHLLGEGSTAWSGGTCSRPLPNGWRLVILNPTHGAAAQQRDLDGRGLPRLSRAIRPTGSHIVAENKHGKTVARDYNEEDEEAAYAVGAAALVPFTRCAVLSCTGKTSREIAQHFNVSRDLVEYRIKVSRLWADYKTRHPEEIQRRDTSRTAAQRFARG